MMNLIDISEKYFSHTAVLSLVNLMLTVNLSQVLLIVKVYNFFLLFLIPSGKR